MKNREPHYQGDAFERAVKETFGEIATVAKIEDTRRLYARYRTDDLLKSLKGAPPRQDGNDHL
jgi:hypothetical protein